MTMTDETFNQQINPRERKTMSKKMIIATMTKSEWEAAQKSGSYAPAALATIGFIHCSFAEQMEKVANAKLQGQNDLVLLVVDPDKLKSEVRYEKSTTWTTESFPHIYGPLNTDAVVKEYPFQPRFHSA
jgi:uncharacterized protein (DUF952 family)